VAVVDVPVFLVAAQPSVRRKHARADNHTMAQLHVVSHWLIVIAARCYASAAYAVVRCVSVRIVHSVKMNERIFKIFSLSGSHTILVFLYQTAWQYSDGTPLMGRQMQVG